MKKVSLLIIIFIASFSTIAYSQKANVRKASDCTLKENPDFNAARDFIKKAIQDSTTKDLAETWYTAGMIGNKENEFFFKKAIQKQDYDKNAKGKAIIESIDYFLQAIKIDSMPDKKGKIKQKYTKDIKLMLRDYYCNQSNLVSYGAYLFQNKDYAGTEKAFSYYLSIPKLSIFKEDLKKDTMLRMDTTYYKIEFYAAYAANKADRKQKAIEYYKDLVAHNYQTLDCYQYMFKIYEEAKDTANFIAILQDGANKFPQDSWFLQNLINYYVYANKLDEALTYLNTAISREPNVPQYYSAKGLILESKNRLDEAMSSFDKALSIEPNLPEAHVAKARFYYNRAVKERDLLEEKDLKDTKKYNAEKKRIDDMFESAIPYLEKASQIDPKNKELKNTLKNVYYRLSKNPEFAKKYDNLDKQMKEAGE